MHPIDKAMVAFIALVLIVSFTGAIVSYIRQ